MVEPGEQSTSTTERVIDVLLTFVGSEPDLGVTQISRRTGLSKAVVHRILQALVDRQVLERSPDGRHYALGPLAFSLASSARRGSRLRAAGLPVITRLCEEIDETTTLSARVGLRRIYVEQVESSRPIRITFQLGEELPLSVGSTGLAILAHLGDAEVQDVLSDPIPRLTDATIVDAETVRRRIAAVRAQGYAVTRMERMTEALGIAAPILDLHGEAIGAVSIGALASRVDAARERDLGPRVARAARAVSERLAATGTVRD